MFGEERRDIKISQQAIVLVQIHTEVTVAMRSLRVSRVSVVEPQGSNGGRGGRLHPLPLGFLERSLGF